MTKIYCEYEREAKLDELRVHPKSPYIHSEDQIITLSRIIENNGWRNNIVVSSRDGKTIVKGRLLYETAKYNDWDKVPIETQEYESEEQELADMVADNKVSSMSEMDDFLLRDVINDISDLEGDVLNTGYNESMLESFIDENDEYIVLGGEKEFEINDEESIKTIKLIYNEEDYEEFRELVTNLCEEQDEVPSRVIYNLAMEAKENEAQDC